jgi:hypothetical protein
MNSQLDRKVLVPLLYTLNRRFRQITKGILVDEPGIISLKKLMLTGQRVVLMPLFKSYLDLAVLTFVLASYNIDIPMAIGNMKDYKVLEHLNYLGKRIGYIQANRSRD